MARSVLRGDVKPDVVHTVSVVSGYPENKILESSSLENDLGMAAALRGALAPNFRRIAQRYNKDAVITSAECKLLKTVGAAIDLVFQRSKTPDTKPRKGGVAVKRSVLLAALTLAFPSPPTLGQGPSFWDRLSLQQTFDAKTVAQPATFALSLPSGGTNTYAIAAGLKVDIMPASVSDVLDGGPFVEYARNTDLKNEQNSLKAGFTANWLTADLSRVPSAFLLQGTVNYARQPLKSSDDLQASIAGTLQPRGRGDTTDALWLPNIRRRLGVLYASYSPYVGVEYDRIVSAKDASQEGSVIRVVGRVQLAAHPASPTWANRLELLTDYEYRYDAHNTTAESGRSHPFFQTSLTVYFLKEADGKRAVGLGVSYVHGADPAKGLAMQEYTQISFKARL